MSVESGSRTKSPIRQLGSDLNERLTVFIKKRGTVKGKLTIFIKYINSFQDAQLTEKQLTEIKLRYDAAKLLLNEFNHIQNSIDELVPESDFVEQLEVRESFENSYYDICSEVTGILRNINDGSDELKSNPQSLVKLPIITLPTFDGSYDNWLEFRDTFISMIHSSNQLDKIQKFHYLRSALTGNAIQVIKSLEFSSINYSTAWDLLNDRYNNKTLLIHNHVKALFSLQSVSRECPVQIRKLIDTVLKNLRSLNTLGENTDSWDTLIIHMITSKLDILIEKEWEQFKQTLNHNSESKLKLNDLIQFLKRKADTLEMIRSNQSHSNSRITHDLFKKPQQRVHSLAAARSNVNKSTRACIKCEGQHGLYACAQFINLSAKDKLTFVTNKKLCLNCLRLGHEASKCQLGSCRQCDKKHNSLLHDAFITNNTSLFASTLHESQSLNSTDTTSNSVVLHSYSHTNNSVSNDSISLNTDHLETVLLSTALVEVAGSDNKYHKARALLDSGSQLCLITESLRNKLNATPIQSTYQITGVGQSITQSNQTCEINLQSLVGKYNTCIKCLVLPCITASLPSVRIINDLEIPENVNLADPTFHTSSKIDILIGADRFWDLLNHGKIRLSSGPFLQNTKLGWIISGPILNTQSCIKKVQCNFTQTLELNEQLKKFWEIEEISSSKQPFSSDEILCEKLFTETTERADNGRFSVRIPLKESPKVLGESYNIAKDRLLSLERRLSKLPPQHKQMYSDFMQEYLALGHMTRIENYTQPCYFLPHHCVIREHSVTTKLRVVFNASQNTSSGKSLNDIQMIGPALQNDLFSILLRFRQYKYVACADIEKMFRQILIQDDQRNLQLILWRENTQQPISVYRLNTVTYGTASAPFLSNRCVRQLGLNCEDKDISLIILNDFYVDDLLTGSDCKQTLIKNCEKISEVCLSGCFPLRKWIFNSTEVDSNIIQNIDQTKHLSLDENHSSKTLGIGWLNIRDEFHFTSNIDTNSNKITKRLMLSIVSQIYDPLGLLGPIVIIGKILLQQLWLCKIDWEDLVPHNIQLSWGKFINSLSELNKLRVPRHAIGVDNPSLLELHIFTDASENAYGACAYIRTISASGDVSVKLLCSKSRVAPIKPVSIPRLELCGALVGARLLDKILKSLRMKFTNIYMWTDSTIVLGWLRISPNQLKTFVQNRVVEISDLTSGAKWMHVSGKHNPADLVSRGVSLSDLSSSSLWWTGPSFLGSQSEQWSNESSDLLDVNYLPEMKGKTCTSVPCSVESNDVIDFGRFSNLGRLQRTCAYVQRFVHNIRTKNRSDRIAGPLTVSELNESLLFLTKVAQQQSFPIEYNCLVNGLQLKASRNISSLNIFLDKHKIIRVGGRLSNCTEFSYNKKHPMLLCSKHYFTQLLFNHEHLQLLHAGPQLLLSHIRETWWPLGGRNLARKIVHQCIRCCRLKGKTLQPIMGNLPSERLQAGFPFIRCGVDYAGPMYILNRRGRGAKLNKVYLCLFVCFATRALHLELVTSLSSECYILALKRFMSRRGKPLQIFSDNGRNFVGAEKEFSNFLQNNSQSIIDYASDNNIEFVFQPPYAAHFGGLIESGVKSCKHHITRVLGNINLTYEEFNTVLIQIEAVLNSRPMYPMSSDPCDFNPLTPAHFLIGRPLTAPADRDDLTTMTSHALSRYKRVEQLRQQFWKSWSRHYVAELQKRTKWQTRGKDIELGTLVIIKEDNLPPLRWRMGRIVSVFPGKDGVSRVASIRTATGIITRAFSKICPLPVCTDDYESSKGLDNDAGSC